VNTVDLTLRLRSIDDFFATPTLSPMSEWYERYSDGSGIDYIIDEVREVPDAEQVGVAVLLPARELQEGLDDRVRAGITRYCDARLRRLDEDRRMSTWRAVRMLIFAIVMVAGLTIAARHLDQTLDTLAVIANVMSIASWVFLWRPIEVLVFQRWERRQDRRALLTVRDHMEVRLAAIDEGARVIAGEAEPPPTALPSAAAAAG
jgi:hypothetical protein